MIRVLAVNQQWLLQQPTVFVCSSIHTFLHATKRTNFPLFRTENSSKRLIERRLKEIIGVWQEFTTQSYISPIRILIWFWTSPWKSNAKVTVTLFCCVPHFQGVQHALLFCASTVISHVRTIHSKPSSSSITKANRWNHRIISQLTFENWIQFDSQVL